MLTCKQKLDLVPQMWIDSESSRVLVIRNESDASREISVLISPPFQLESGSELPTVLAARAEALIPIVLPPAPAQRFLRVDEHDAFPCALKGFVSVRGASRGHVLLAILDFSGCFTQT